MSDQLPEKSEPTPEGLMARWKRTKDANGFVCESSMPMVTPQDRGRILDILDGECLAGGDLIGANFWLGDYIAHPVQLTDPETAEVIDAIRIVLPQPDAPPIAFVSIGILKSIARLSWKEGRTPPFDPPLRVKLRQVSARGGRRTFKLVSVTE